MFLALPVNRKPRVAEARAAAVSGTLPIPPIIAAKVTRLATWCVGNYGEQSGKRMAKIDQSFAAL
jgi:hypothetical protein